MPASPGCVEILGSRSRISPVLEEVAVAADGLSREVEGVKSVDRGRTVGREGPRSDANVLGRISCGLAQSAGEESNLLGTVLKTEDRA